MTKWRLRAFREVRDELDRFLNYPLNQEIKLGDYGHFNGRRCRFEWLGNLSDIKIPVGSAGFQTEIAETYATAGAVRIQGRLSLGGVPAADISFKKHSALAFQGHKIGFDQAQLTALGQALNTAIRNGLKWDRSRIIVTQLWRAEGFTHLVSGSRQAGVEIEASAPATPIGFNFADPSLGLQVAAQRAMSYCAVGQTEVKPYFSVHKLREIRPGEWALYRYGLPA